MGVPAKGRQSRSPAAADKSRDVLGTTVRTRPYLFSQRHHKLQERIHLTLGPEVVGRPAAQSASNANGDRSAADREGILIILVVSHAEYPVASQPVALCKQSRSLVRIAVHD